MNNNKPEKLNSYLVGGILASMGLIALGILFFIFVGMVSDADKLHTDAAKKELIRNNTWKLTIAFLAFIACAGGAFICAIIGLVGTSRYYENSQSSGVMRAAGIVGILGIPIVNIILFFMAYASSKNKDNGNYNNGGGSYNQNNNGSYNNQNNNQIHDKNNDDNQNNFSK